MNRIKNNRGFTLIETIFSLMVFLILFLAISFLITTIAVSTYKARFDYSATLIAQKRIEEIKSIGEIVEGYNSYNYKDFFIEEEVISIKEYKNKVYKIVLKVYKNDVLLETMKSVIVME